jgi:hypothetical protein
MKVMEEKAYIIYPNESGGCAVFIHKIVSRSKSRISNCSSRKTRSRKLSTAVVSIGSVIVSLALLIVTALNNI